MAPLIRWGLFVSTEPKKEAKSTTGRRSTGAKPPRYRIPDERYQAARIIYESTPGMSYVKLADMTGISWRSLEDRGREEGWTRRELLPPKGLNEAAQAVADKYSGKLAEYGPELSPEQAKQAALVDTVAEVAVDVRGQLIERHRREWGAIRTMVYEGIKKREYGDIAKLAKISAETLQIVQSNERKAWGIDKAGDGDAKLTVVIERGV